MELDSLQSAIMASLLVASFPELEKQCGLTQQQVCYLHNCFDNIQDEFSPRQMREATISLSKKVFTKFIEDFSNEEAPL